MASGSNYPVPEGYPAPAYAGTGPGAIAVVGPQFLAPYPVDLVITRKLMTLSEGRFGVTDTNGNLMFKIKGKFFSLRNRRVLLDAADHPIISFQQKILTAHRRWKVFRGDNSDDSNIIFTVRKSSLLQFKTKLDVFLSSNSAESVCDFRIEGSWFERSCTIYAGNSSTIIAQMHRKHSVQSVFLGKDTFGVTVYPNVDCAFIVALVVILEEINEDRQSDDYRPSIVLTGDDFEEFSVTVQDYLMMQPLGRLSSSLDNSIMEENYKTTVQELKRFRFIVHIISKQCTDPMKLQSLLDHAGALVLSILHMAYVNDVIETGRREVEESIFRSSSHMSSKLSPHNPDVMELYMQALLAEVEIMKASKPSSSPGSIHSMVESFHNFLQSAHSQVGIMVEILDHPVMDSKVEMLLKQGCAVVAREASSLISSIDPNHTELSNLLHKLNFIKDQLFVLELHNHKASFCFGQSTFSEAFSFLRQFVKMREVSMSMMDTEYMILALIESSLKETQSFCDSYQSKPFSETMILESSFAIFKLFKAEATLMVFIDNTLSASRLKFLAEFRTDNVLTSSERSFFQDCSIETSLLLDKFHDFLYQCLNSSVLWTDRNSAMRAIKFVKTFLFVLGTDWSCLDEANHFTHLFEGTKTYIRWLQHEITKVLECKDLHHLDSAITQSLLAVDLLRINVGEAYGELVKVPHPVFVIDGVAFVEFADLVLEFLMTVPKEPFEWGRSTHDFTSVQANYMNTVQKLKHFKYLVLTISNQCTDQKKLQSILAPAGDLVLSILHMAHLNNASYTLRGLPEEYIFSSSFDMSDRLSPQNLDAMELYLEVVSANVNTIKASKQSSGPGEFFLNLLRSAQNQVCILDHILDIAIIDLTDRTGDRQEQVNTLLKQYAVIGKQAGTLCFPTPNDDVFSKLLQKLNLIKAEIFVLELHNHRSSLTCLSERRAFPIKKALIFLSQFLKTQTLHLEGIEKLILSLIEAFLGEAGSFCESCDAEGFSDMIIESSLAIFKIFKAETLLMLLSHNSSSFKVLAEWDINMLQRSLILLRESLLVPTNDDAKDGNTTASKAAPFVCSFGDRNKELNQPRRLPCQSLWPLFSDSPKSDGVVFAEHLLGRLKKFVFHEPDRFAKYQISSLLGELELLMSFLSGFEREDSKKKDLDLQVTGLIYDAEYITDMIMFADVPSCYKHLVLFIISEETKFVKGKILDIKRGYESFALPVQDIQLTCISEGSNLRTGEVIVGFDDQAEKIMDQLRYGSKNLAVVSIVGMAGIGKTTLAKKVYRNSSIQYHFAVCAQSSVSQVYRKRKLLLELLGSSVDVTGDMDDNDLALKLKQKLHGNRYLILLDDVWSIEHWNDLQLSFPDENKGSRILFTTRDQAVARKAAPGREPFVLHLLGLGKSWDLLQAKLFQGGHCPEQLLEVGRLVAENCRGLPLAIVVIAGILTRKEMKEEEWKEIAKHLRSIVTEDEETQFMGMLELSYNHLPSYLKPCFLYLGSFLEDQEISAKKLQWLWMGEGFIPTVESMSLEKTAEGYLKELINRSLVMEATRGSLGGTKTCRIHDMLRHLCLKKAKEEKFMQLLSMNGLVNSDLNVGNEYRLSVHSQKENFIQLKPSASHVHSLLFFATDNTLDNKSNDISSTVQDFKLLRVLDLEPITASTFPSGTDLLLGLNYLAIKGNIKSVPSSISKLWNLGTLIVKGTRGDIALPSSLWSMEMLRHVHVRPQATLTLSNTELESAKVLVNLTTFSSPVFHDRKASEKILKRCIRLTKLRCIFMQQWDGSLECPVFPSLEFLFKLQSLNLYNGGRSLPAELAFPLNLKKLTLSRFCLKWDHISVISRLSNLVVLKLLFKAFDGDTWEMIEESFPKLKVLKLENLNLANWNNSLDCADHFPELERLVLRYCKNLKEVPSNFGEVPTLKMMEVNWCSPSAAISIKTIIDQQMDFGNPDFQVMIAPSEWDFRHPLK